jgi:hypothetical protein
MKDFYENIMTILLYGILGYEIVSVLQYRQ